MLHTYCEALRGATHMAGCQCSLWASSGCSLSLVLCHSTSVSCVPVCDWLRDWALECATPLTSCMGGGKVCVWHRESEQEREKYTPFFFRAPSPSSPLAPWLLLGEFLSAYVCVCVCVILLPQGARLSPGGCTDCHTAMSGSDKYIFIFWHLTTPSLDIPVLCSEVEDSAHRRWGHFGACVWSKIPKVQISSF